MEIIGSNRELSRSFLSAPDLCLTAIQGSLVSSLLPFQHSRSEKCTSAIPHPDRPNWWNLLGQKWGPVHEDFQQRARQWFEWHKKYVAIKRTEAYSLVPTCGFYSQHWWRTHLLWHEIFGLRPEGLSLSKSNLGDQLLPLSWNFPSFFPADGYDTALFRTTWL